ncbi:ABC transporter substrate-binding protein [Paenibacillus prosopidis]|uniref:Multiple sugar transport system substrate-binding protein n=1 Tax=Paenibacillus prosopidis TaxID=630520 RepID=A0A368VKL9_9BACL|nr:extracellular solute-binding protein [Paenibacillus prosopidis]RCW41971.1 multiple sugar transport system substrate-binding protein [Paenibacillus prosopidis]
MKSWFKFVLPVVLIVIIISGCSFGAGNNGEDENQQDTLRVMHYDEGSFYQDYGMLFTALFPNVSIEVISTQGIHTEETTDYKAATIKFIEEKKPDIVMLDSEQYKTMAADGKLYDLDALIEKEKYDTEGLVPGMLDYLRELGGGKLYGLAPSFYSQALFYNKDLFEEYKIEPPTDRMSWNDVIQLARRFPTDGEEKDRIYGLKMGYSDDLFELAGILTSADGINYVNATQKLMTINSDSWKNAFNTALGALESDTLYFESMQHQESNMGSTYEEYLLSDPFISGRLAMAIGDFNYINQIKQATNHEKVKELVVKNWDMVSVPVGQQFPDQSNMMAFHNVLAITADSPNKETAWEFLKYLSSDEYARVKSKSNHYNGLPVRTKYIKDDEGRNYAAFYSLKPSTFNSYKDFEKLPENFWMEFRNVAQQELQKVKEGTAALEETLELLQVKGQELLEKEDPAIKNGNTPAVEGAGGTVQ